MKTIPIFQVDAFAEGLFKGNPAAVCLLDKWLPKTTMQNIAFENNLAETAFVLNKGDYFEIHWFTPTVEVDLCGHATLASAHVLFEEKIAPKKEIFFVSPRSGDLEVKIEKEDLFLNFPTDNLRKEKDYSAIKKCIGIKPTELFRGKSDYIAVLESEEQVQSIIPFLPEIEKLKARGLVVTAPGSQVDFVSRFFAPQSGIAEDPVTGSAHTSLTPYWAKRLNKYEMNALQLSSRGGKLTCRYAGKRCHIGGKTQLYLKGHIYIP